MCKMEEDISSITDDNETSGSKDDVGEEEEDADDEDDDESEVNLTDVLGDIDELIVEAEKAMKEEQEKARPPSEEPEQQEVGSQQGVCDVILAKAHWKLYFYGCFNLLVDLSLKPDTFGMFESLPKLRQFVKDQPPCRKVKTDRAGPSASSSRRERRPAPQPVNQQAKKNIMKNKSEQRKSEIELSLEANNPVMQRKLKNNPSRRLQLYTVPNDKLPQRFYLIPGWREAHVIEHLAQGHNILQEEVSRQQIILNQTSQALSLIASNESLRNTVEEIEAEKMMVISNQKRQACLSEIQYLKNAPIPEPVFTDDGEEVVPSKGHVLIKEIRLAFKTEYIMDLQSNKEMPSHYYFIVTRCGAQTTVTNLMNTRENLTGDCLKFPTEITINDLDGDFSIESLVYQLRSTVTRVEGMAERAQTQHALPVRHSRFGSLTPKKLLSNKSSSKKNKQNMKYFKATTQSSKSSHHGQGSSRPVRGSSFALVGSVRLSLASCGTTKFMLSRVPLTSPLEGSIHLCMSCQKNSSIVLKGFLTMFDEISGFGSWHRRWCVLAEGYVTCWKYPDDERKKPPIASIDLRECVSKEVAQISRILCARPNTFELVTQRPASRYEKDTLISTCNNSMLETKHMISADVKEERVEWIDALNRTLHDLRMWNKDAAVPRE
ncbi:putative actin-binding protein anillin-like isoform X2 [Apostichopus japonicus]|uniref:Putative actin-binding protein anillin-like isoform X2 n=1 Tax=Stichopus japonicus TaxID=307972 RepID=A0A2G8KZL0_STIJA|nr:putative actin-binding protein anillin-like isoform X2 [Apostichopus japonicus]